MSQTPQIRMLHLILLSMTVIGLKNHVTILPPLLAVLLFLLHYVKGELKLSHLFMMLFLLAGLTVGPLMGAITEFGPTEASRQIYPAYEEWGLATIGRFIEHMDFFFDLSMANWYVYSRRRAAFWHRRQWARHLALRGAGAVFHVGRAIFYAR